MKRVALILFFLLPLAIHAANRPLVEHVPKGASNDVVMAIIKQAFMGRGWTIDKIESSAVSAHISRATLRTVMRIEFVDGALLYDGMAKRRPGGSPAQAAALVWTTGSLPDDWVTNLQRDISLSLAAIPDR